MKLTKKSGIMKFDQNSKRVSADQRQGEIKFEVVFLTRMKKWREDFNGFVKKTQNRKLTFIFLKTMRFLKKSKEQMEVFLIRKNLYALF